MFQTTYCHEVRISNCKFYNHDILKQVLCTMYMASKNMYCVLK